VQPERFLQHQLEVAKVCPRHVVLRDGGLPLEGLPDLGLRFGSLAIMAGYRISSVMHQVSAVDEVSLPAPNKS
jgi:hypothetical protein